MLASGLALGWTGVPHGPYEMLGKFGGLTLTWFAVLLGAPFWFDLLKAFVPIRMSGLKPDQGDAAARDAQLRTSRSAS